MKVLNFSVCCLFGSLVCLVLATPDRAGWNWNVGGEQTCPLMGVTCRLGCGQTMQLKMLAEHEGSLCSERLVACRWQCLEDVKVGQAELVSCVVSS